MNYAVLVESAIFPHRLLLLGSGPSKAAAMADAFGSDKGGWNKRAVKASFVKVISDDELDSYRYDSAN